MKTDPLSFNHVLFYGRGYDDEKPPREAVAQGWRDISLAFERMRGRTEENAGLDIEAFTERKFHRAAVHELIRVCRGEVRLYPVMTYGTNRLHPYVAQIIGQLAADGLSLRLENSEYEQGRITGHLVLIIDTQKWESRTETHLGANT